MVERVYAEFSDGRKGWYIVADEHPDRSLDIRPAAPEEIQRAGDDRAPPSPPSRRSDGSAPSTA